MPSFTITINGQKYKTEATSKKAAEKKIKDHLKKNVKTLKSNKKTNKERKTKKDNQLKDTKGSDMNGYYMKKVMVDYKVNYNDGNIPTSRMPFDSGWEPAGGIAVAGHRGKGVLGSTARYTWAQAWVKYEYVKTKM